MYLKKPKHLINLESREYHCKGNFSNSELIYSESTIYLEVKVFGQLNEK
jgi:hypothetical protein